MRDGFLRVSSVTPHMAVAYVPANGEEIRARMLEAVQDGAKVVVFPELRDIPVMISSSSRHFCQLQRKN